ncbi:MAG TPA: 6-bladed beta-propeller [Candidatus Coprenecus stercorigallinarum]|nr:6-bladed beta-propeller [Candidatus Coprenecus stercorigallinarum]
MYKILSIALISVVMLSSCAEKTGMPGFSVFNMSVRNEVVQIPSEGLIDDVSIVKLDNSSGAPVIGIIEDAYESENAYYIVSSETVYEYAKDGSFVRRIGAKGRGPGEYLNPQGIGMSGGRLYVFDYNTQNILTYGEDGSFIASYSQSALMNSGIYLSSFFFSGGDMILYASSNSPVQDMLRWDVATDRLTAVSERSREMLPEEAVMGENYIFGDRDNPFIYNNFNDTVYVLEGGRPVPLFLMRLGKYRFEYGDLTFDGLMSLTASRLIFNWIAAAGENVLISYSVSIGEKSFPYLGLYNTRTGEYSQNVEITGIPEDFAAITPTERLFEGMQDDELLSVRPVSDTGDEYVIIKYRFK